MSKDIDRAFLSSITYGLGGLGDIDCICAVISVFLIRRGYHGEINVISRENDSGRATIECWCYDDDNGKLQNVAITVWHSKGWYNVCRGICDKKRPNEAETVEFSPYLHSDDDYPELLDFLDSVFPEPADADMEYDYFSKLFLGRIGSDENEACAQAKNEVWAEIREYIGDGKRRSNIAKWIDHRPPIYSDTYKKMTARGEFVEVSSGGKREKSIRIATSEEREAYEARHMEAAKRAGYAIKGREILKNQDDVERIIFCALLDLMEDARNFIYFAHVIFTLLMWRGYDDVFLNIIPCVRHISLEVPTTILSEGLETCIEISDDASCVLKVTVNKQKLDGRRIEPDAVYKQSVNSKYDPSFKGNTYDGLYDFLSEKFPRMDKCYSNDLRMPAYLNVAGLQSCFSSQHANVELDPIRFYPRSLTKEIYKLEKANNGQVICRICHKPIETFSDCSADHIVPYSKGGKTTLSNMQLAHKSCNSKKRDKIKSDDDENWIV